MLVVARNDGGRAGSSGQTVANRGSVALPPGNALNFAPAAARPEISAKMAKTGLLGLVSKLTIARFLPAWYLILLLQLFDDLIAYGGGRYFSVPGTAKA